jgi:hypothetical protein
MARALLDEALELSQLLDHRGYMATINRRLAQLALARGEPDAARGHVRASLEMARASSIGALGLQSLQLASRLAGALGDHPRAVRLRAAVAGWQGDHAAWPGSTVWAGWTWTSRDDDETLRAAHTALGESAFAAAWAEGSLLSLDDALDVALTTVGPEHDLAPPGR